MHAGLVDEEPQHDAKQQIDDQAPHAGVIQRDQHGEHHPGTGDRVPRNSAAVEQGNHQDRTHVIDDRERREEDLEAGGGARRDDRQGPQREGNVGGHRNRPATGRNTPIVGRHVEQGGKNHPTDSGGNRQRSLARRRQFPRDGFTLYLEPHEQKEHRHEGVVDPLVERQRHAVAAHGDADGRRPQSVIGIGPARVGDNQCRAGTHDQERATCRFRIDEFLESNRGALTWPRGHPSTMPQCGSANDGERCRSIQGVVAVGCDPLQLERLFGEVGKALRTQSRVDDHVADVEFRSNFPGTRDRLMQSCFGHRALSAQVQEHRASPGGAGKSRRRTSPVGTGSRP